MRRTGSSTGTLCPGEPLHGPASARSAILIHDSKPVGDRQVCHRQRRRFECRETGLSDLAKLVRSHVGRPAGPHLNNAGPMIQSLFPSASERPGRERARLRIEDKASIRMEGGAGEPDLPVHECSPTGTGPPGKADGDSLNPHALAVHGLVLFGDEASSLRRDSASRTARSTEAVRLPALATFCPTMLNAVP